ncbi:MAG: hypothetical protein NTZ56_24030 [Acidobacteria bacterium]|nr:hypothetical protein [Acidobacteriota bacterium]
MKLLVMLAALLSTALAMAQQPPPPPPPAPQQPAEPPEEDESLKAPKEYTFNPLQAEGELKVGNYYFKKGSFKAAARRFEEASRWNPGLGEAYLRWGESLEKAGDRKGAAAAFSKYLEVVPDAKNADAIRKKIKARP